MMLRRPFCFSSSSSSWYSDRLVGSLIVSRRPLSSAASGRAGAEEASPITAKRRSKGFHLIPTLSKFPRFNSTYSSSGSSSSCASSLAATAGGGGGSGGSSVDASCCYSVLASRGSGPGGQGANSSSSKVEVRVDLDLLEMFIEDVFINYSSSKYSFQTSSSSFATGAAAAAGSSSSSPSLNEAEVDVLARQLFEEHCTKNHTHAAADGDDDEVDSALEDDVDEGAEKRENGGGDEGVVTALSNHKVTTPTSSSSSSSFSSVSDPSRYQDAVHHDPEADLSFCVTPWQRIVEKIRSGKASVESSASGASSPSTTTSATLADENKRLILTCNQFRSNHQNISACLDTLRVMIYNGSFVAPTEERRLKSFRASNHAVTKAKLKRQMGSNKRRAQQQVRKGLW